MKFRGLEGQQHASSLHYILTLTVSSDVSILGAPLAATISPLKDGCRMVRKVWSNFLLSRNHLGLKNCVESNSTLLVDFVFDET